MYSKELWRLYYRLHFYMDAAAIHQWLKFRGLRARYYRELWDAAARRIGGELEQWDFGFYRISRGGMTTFVSQGSVMLDNHLMLEIMGNKALTYALLEEKGYEVPPHCTYSMRQISEARAFMDTQGGPLVVKPTSGTGGGRGVTTGITDVASLKKASRLAARFDSSILIERQLTGDVYRLLYLDGQFIDAVRRDPPTITGDGHHNIKQLIKLENRRRLQELPITALSPLAIDNDCINKLRSAGLSVRSRLENGRTIVVKQAINENDAVRNHNVKHQVHPDTIAQGAQLVRDLGVRFAGLDVICHDITSPLFSSNGMITEVNTTPGIHHHYLISDATHAVPVAELVLEHLFSDARNVMLLGKKARSHRPPNGSNAQELTAS